MEEHTQPVGTGFFYDLLQRIFKQPLFGCKVCHCKCDTVHVCFGGTVFFASGFGPRKEGLADTHGIAFTVHKGQKFPQQLCNRVDATLVEVREKGEEERERGWVGVGVGGEQRK